MVRRGERREEGVEWRCEVRVWERELVREVRVWEGVTRRWRVWERERVWERGWESKGVMTWKWVVVVVAAERKAERREGVSEGKSPRRWREREIGRERERRELEEKSREWERGVLMEEGRERKESFEA